MVTTRSSLRRRRRDPSPPPPPRSTTTTSAAEAGAQDLLNPNTNPNPNTTLPFACNICLETSKNPVVTHCGHLFCWACLYRWVYLHSPSRDCPVCKAPVDVGSNHAAVVPIFGTSTVDRVEQDVPPRPPVKGGDRGDGRLRVFEEAEELLDRARSLVGRASVHLMVIDELLGEISARSRRLEEEEEEEEVGARGGGEEEEEEEDEVVMAGVETRAAARVRRMREEEVGSEVRAARRRRRTGS